MSRDEWFKEFNKLPSAAQEYLLDPVSGVNEDAAQTSLGYDNDAWERVMDVVWELLFKKLDSAEFQSLLKKVAGDRKLGDVETQVLKNVVLPLSDLLMWDVDVRLQELGVPGSQIQNLPRVSLRPVSYGAAVRRIAVKAKLSILSEETARRLREVLISFLKGVRTQEQVVEILQRPQNEGGLGFDRGQAEAYFKALSDFIASTQVMSEEEYARWFQEYQREKEKGESDVDKSKVKSQKSKLESEEEQIGFKSSGSQSLDQAVDAVMADGAVGGLASIKDEYLAKRLRNTVSTRLRDVRNDRQVGEILARDVKVGGLGLSSEDTDKVAAAIERVYAATRQAIASEERGQIEATLQEQKRVIEERRAAESEEHARWYQQKIAASRPENLSAELLRMSRENIKSGAKRSPAELRDGEAKSVDGIVPPVRLMGLAEELSQTDINAFRRLSDKPEQAAQQLVRKLETLKQESFERWTEGVAAWRRSPLQQQYLRLVTDSFREGKPVSELADERRQTDPSVPSSSELGAIIALNAKIQL